MGIARDWLNVTALPWKEGVVVHSAQVVTKRARVCGVPVTTIALWGVLYWQALGWKHRKMRKAQGVTIF
jgi:hypothetical protein